MNGSSFSNIQPISGGRFDKALQTWEITTANYSPDLIPLVSRMCADKSSGKVTSGITARAASIDRFPDNTRPSSVFTHSTRWGLQPRYDVIRRSQILYTVMHTDDTFRPLSTS